MIPCYNRKRDAALLLDDLAALDLHGGRLGLSVLLVDNASTEPLSGLPAPAGLDIRHLRLPVNTGGSGGFSRGMQAWIDSGTAGDPHELIWLLDSDVRVEPGALLPLVEALEHHPELAGVGSVLVDPETRDVFEMGGEVDPRTGEYVQPLLADWKLRRLVPAGYVAACSLLVRRGVVERTGVMADLFVNGDDIEWCYRARACTGLGFAVATSSRVRHPNPDRMRTWARYYAARNARVAIAAAGIPGRRAVIARSLREVARAAGQLLVGRDDLAELHIAGLRDSAHGRKGKAPEDTITFEAFQPLDSLARVIIDALPTVRGRVMIRRGVLRDPTPLIKALNAVCVAPDVVPPETSVRGLGVVGLLWKRLWRAPDYGVAVVSARGKPEDWLSGRIIITVAPEGFVMRRVSRWNRAVALARLLFRGAIESWRVGRRTTQATLIGSEAGIRGVARRPTLSIVILSYNRWPALEQTLSKLQSDHAARESEIIVVDNGSSDGSAEKAASKFPRVRVVPLKRNAGIAGFNEGVWISTGEAVLILDDDAVPDTGVLDRALERLAARPDVCAISLLPVHPGTRKSEWNFAQAASDRWPIMGCGNIIRRTAWDRVGGYEESFFLYRNDVDLAMKLLDAGYRVDFNPAWVVWHDSPAAQKKSLRWFELATRNWMWLCRRHGCGVAKWKSMVAGWMWTHRAAGFSPAAHAAAIKGAMKGLFLGRPATPIACHRRTGMSAYLHARFG